MSEQQALKPFYPPLKIYKEHRLRVSDIHELHIQESGDPEGVPVLFNHGGPGGGINETHGRQFNPEHYRLIQFDQRGSGKSTPYADIRENTTQDLINDIEAVREHLGISSWIVAGRSWGTTLSLLYAQAHRMQVRALYLAAVFLCDRQSINWLFQEGASRVYPQQWEDFVSIIPEAQRGNLMAAYQQLLNHPDSQVAENAARHWSTWEAHTCTILPDEDAVAHFTSPGVMLAISRLECHYLSNGGFIQEGQILRDIEAIEHIPTTIIHGRYDMNCTFDNAWRLHKALPKSKLIVVPVGGHSASDDDTIDKQIRAADAWT